MDSDDPVASAVASAIASAIASTIRDERLTILAGLIRRTGDWELAEDCLQDAVERALARWPADGVPANPAGWLTVTARRRAVDLLRRRSTETEKLKAVAIMDELTRRPGEESGDEPPGWTDDRLKLIFTCCHPALPLAGRVALTCRTVAGMSTAAIASAFLVSEATMSQRLLRARTKISNAGIGYRVPDPQRIDDRLGGVLAVLYLIFTEGYRDPAGPLAAEAVRLADLLAALLPADGEVAGLQALLCFQHARRAARTDPSGELVSIEEQDRSRFDRALIERGLAALDRVANTPAGRYRLQAQIAGLHAVAPSAPDTDWPAVLERYDALARIDPSPVIALNRLVALSFAVGPEAALADLDAVGAAPALARSPLVPAVRADLLRRTRQFAAATTSYRAAIELSADGPEQRFLRRRLAECTACAG